MSPLASPFFTPFMLARPLRALRMPGKKVRDVRGIMDWVVTLGRMGTNAQDAHDEV